ncbi:Hypothetical protein DEACI_2139 [Acididesulfobacillus acetoxydans]|uniref:Uncharacterized protein n=1 Tax=Acididesulfobacillus acetoxydans TaxID=1561005 RepID=A0A8S0WFZ9_9FIRM|nr:hypothetical protein [Acididesulfobacillus acetoxydans]CAA7601472.1 Hypothetical protein DEACI_2139 [Acididesulfobacillus acetoxydans]CEJ06127.1 Hypothetical protein DEACI_0573 [Acididesulfobacillus acetoxydans]
MDDQTREAMLKIIEDKKRKSASQKGWQRGQGRLGNPQTGVKKYKKGGLFDK